MAGAIPKQTQEDIVPPPPVAVGYRLGGVLLAPAVVVAVQVILEAPVGIELQIPEAPGSSALQALGVGQAAAVTLVLGILAWVAVVVLERGLGGDRGRTIFTWAAVGVTLLSLLPVLATDITTAQQWGLVVLHAVAALVLIPSMTARGTAGEHGPTNLGDPPSAGDVGDDGHHPGHDDDYVHAAPAADAQDDSAHDDDLDH